MFCNHQNSKNRVIVTLGLQGHLAKFCYDRLNVGPKVTLSSLCVLMITKHIKAIWY